MLQRSGRMEKENLRCWRAEKRVLKDLERVSFSLVEGSFRTDAFVTGEGQRKERHNVLG